MKAGDSIFPDDTPYVPSSSGWDPAQSVAISSGAGALAASEWSCSFSCAYENTNDKSAPSVGETRRSNGSVTARTSLPPTGTGTTSLTSSTRAYFREATSEKDHDDDHSKQASNQRRLSERLIQLGRGLIFFPVGKPPGSFFMVVVASLKYALVELVRDVVPVPVVCFAESADGKSRRTAFIAVIVGSNTRSRRPKPRNRCPLLGQRPASFRAWWS